MLGDSCQREGIGSTAGSDENGEVEEEKKRERKDRRQ